MSSAAFPSWFDESADFEGKLEPLHWYNWPNTKKGLTRQEAFGQQNIGSKFWGVSCLIGHNIVKYKFPSLFAGVTF